VTPAAFNQNFPEFIAGGTSPVLILAKLNQAAARMGGPDFSVWPQFAQPGALPSLSDIAHGNLAAHYIQSAAFGTETRLKPSESKTGYWEVWEDCCDSVAGGFITSGEVPRLNIASNPTSLVLQVGNGTVSVVNGSTAITWAALQTLPAGSLVVFYSQPGVYYELATNVQNSINGILTAPYEGTTSPNANWAF
jgi:hypothetical protein